MSALRKPKPTRSTQASYGRTTPPPERFGHFDKKSGAWIGRTEELGSDEVVADLDHPKDIVRVQRILTGVLALRQSGKVGDAEVTAADRWFRDWSRGTGHPLRASEARFLGVSLGGAASSDGIPVAQLDAATRHREAAQAVGARATERLTAFVSLGMSINAASSLLGVTRQDLGGSLVADLERLAQHYDDVDTGRARSASGRRWRD